MRVLAGDIGGTHTRLALAQLDGTQVTVEQVLRVDNAERDGPEASIADLLAQGGPVDACCLAVAGPTDGLRARFTNLSWLLDANELSKRFSMPVRLVNDFAAVGWGLNALQAANLSELQTGSMVPGAARVALGAGTGLGVTFCAPRGRFHVPLDSEGGHIGFAAVDAEQDRLLTYLREEHGRVSVERLLSGPGIVSLYRFSLRESGCRDSEVFADPQPARAISQAALTGNDTEAVRALRLFARIYGQVAGDLALLVRAEAGVFLAGGIAPQVRTLLEKGDFIAGFHAKGRFSHWMRQLPVRIILDTDIGLKGAALAASSLVTTQ
jgi:glucokinase